jgi:hypothetical protein
MLYHQGYEDIEMIEGDAFLSSDDRQASSTTVASKKILLQESRTSLPMNDCLSFVSEQEKQQALLRGTCITSKSNKQYSYETPTGPSKNYSGSYQLPLDLLFCRKDFY